MGEKLAHSRVLSIGLTKEFSIPFNNGISGELFRPCAKAAETYSKGKNAGKSPKITCQEGSLRREDPCPQGTQEMLRRR